MTFVSIPFFLFFLTLFFIYWFVLNKNFKAQNVLLLISSYIFYAWADWRFLFFLIAVSILNFYLGIKIEKSSEKSKKIFLYIGLILGIGSLFLFKYLNFLSDFINSVCGLLGINLSLSTVNFLIPLGISFFTFRTINYLLDIKNGKIKSAKDLLAFCTYVAFFPALISGPIDRARNFIPQLEIKRVFNPSFATDGLRQILWGLIKKLVVANNCSFVANQIFQDYPSLPSSSLLLAAFLFTVQIYADFSGYSDMAIGFAKLLGFRIAKNFEFPFFSQNITEFWRKWHISLTSWLTEYVFTPLTIVFRDYGNWGLIIAILINFSLVGLWHGASWTYIFYGFVNGLLFIPYILKGTLNKKKKNSKEKTLPGLKELALMFSTFSIVVFTILIFKAPNMSMAFDYYKTLVSSTVFSIPVIPTGRLSLLISMFFIFLMFTIEWLNREYEHGLSNLGMNWPKPLRVLFYYFLFFSIFLFAGKEEGYIYAQF